LPALLKFCRIILISEYSRFDPPESGRLQYHFLQQLDPFIPLVIIPNIVGDADDIAARPRQTLHNAELDGITEKTPTIGIVVVAAFKSTLSKPMAMITSGLRRTTSRAKSG